MRVLRKHFPLVLTMFISVFVFYSYMFNFPISLPNADAIPTAPPWDFQDHTMNHADLTTLNNSQIIEQLTSVNAAFQAHGLPMPKHIAYPNGAYNTQVIDIASQYRLSGRLASGRYSSETYPIQNWYALHVVSLVASTTVDKAKELIDDAIKKKGLMNILTHSVLDPPDGYGCSPTTLSQILDYLVAQQNAGKLSILTMSQAYNQYDGQKAVVVVSFDDGWYTDYTIAWPMFKTRGIAGTSFITINNVNSNFAARLNWTQVCEMAQINQSANLGWSININSMPPNAGTTTPLGSISSLHESLTVTAVSKSDYLFTHWLFNENILTSNPVVLPAQPDRTNHILTAHFTSAPSPTPSITPTTTSTLSHSDTLAPTPTELPFTTAAPTPTPELIMPSALLLPNSPCLTPTITSQPTPGPTSSAHLSPQNTSAQLATPTFSPTQSPTPSAASPLATVLLAQSPSSQASSGISPTSSNSPIKPIGAKASNPSPTLTIEFVGLITLVLQ